MDGKHAFKYDYGNIRLSLQKVVDYPFHWHEGIEIILVLKGSIVLEVYKDPDMITPLAMKKNDIFVTGVEEVHRLHSSDENNAVLLLQIDKSHISTIFDFSDNLEFDYLFYTYNAQEQEVLNHILNEVKFLSALIIDDGSHKNEKDILHLTNNLLYLLIDNFEIINRKLNRDGHSRKYYERLMRITNYIENNVSSKNLLTEISKVEYLNPDYISHELKKKLDFTFQQAVNFYRIQNAIRLLLNSDLNISDIAYECGFSAPRYFYKHFTKIHSGGPLNFRKLYQKRFRNIDFINAYEEITNIHDFLHPAAKRKFIEDNILWLDIDMSLRGGVLNHSWKNSLTISDIDDVSTLGFYEKLLLIQTEIGFRSVRIRNMFDNFDKSPPGVSDYLTRILFNLNILMKNGLNPLIVLKAEEFNTTDKTVLLNQFLIYAEKEFGRSAIKNWMFEISKSAVSAENLINMISECTPNIIYSDDDKTTPEICNPLADTIFKATEIIGQFSDNNIETLLPMDRSLSENGSGIFSGCNGLITSNGLLKPAFHACSFLSLLGDELLLKGDYYIVTRRYDSIQILLFNHIPLGAEEPGPYQAFCINLYDETLTKKINIKLKNINGSYKATSFVLNNKEGSIHNILLELEQPAFLNGYDKKLLNKITAPHISFEIITDKSFSYNISLEPYSVKLVVLDRI